jgi:chromosomal replication initiator protein
MTDVTLMARTAGEIWSAALGDLQVRVTRSNFDTWLRDTIGLRLDDGRLVVGVQHDFATEWLALRLRALIVQSLAQVAGTPLEVAFEVVRGERDALPPLVAPEAPATPPARPVVRPALNPALTFAAFVVGEENRLACEASRSAAAGPGGPNPLVVFGESGLGKTHLLQAIAHEAFERGRSVLFAPAERFGNDYVKARNAERFDDFRARYRHADIVLIDDFQFFEGKEKFQKEFFHAFNDVHGDGRQIVVSVDRLPSKLLGVMEPLRSRLQWGLLADLQKPSYETRLAILRAKASRQALRLSEEVLRAIAARSCPSVRELEGYLNRVLAHAPLLARPLTEGDIARALSPLTPAASQAPASADEVVAAVCRRTGVQAADLYGKSRARDVTYARHLAMFVLKEDARRAVAEIGRLFGGRDHSTVLSGVQRVRGELTTRAETSADVEAVRGALAAPPLAAAAS